MSKRHLSAYDFLNYRIVADPQLSPDGSRLLFTMKRIGAHNGYHTGVWIASIESKQDVRPYTSGYNDTCPRWSPDGERIAFIRGDGYGNGQLYIMSYGGGEATPIAFFPEGRMTDIQWAPNGRWIAVRFRECAEEWSGGARARRRELGLSDPPMITDTLCYRSDGDGYFNGQRPSIYLVDTLSGGAHQIYEGDTLGRFSFDFSPDSQSLAITANRDPAALLVPWMDELLILDIAQKRLRPIEGIPVCKKFRAKWSPDGTRIAFGGFLGHQRAYCPDNVELFVCDVKSGNTKSVTSSLDLCFQGHLFSEGVGFGTLDPTYLWAPDGKHLWAAVTKAGERHLVFIDVATGDTAFQTCGHYHYELGNRSADGKVLSMTRGDALSLPEVCIGYVKEGEFVVEQITQSNVDTLAELELAKPEAHWVESSDGVKIQVWVMRPPGMDASEVTPGILDIHGGPLGAFGEGFLHDAQVLAAQGYTVFYPNIRGSKGYGREFSLPLRTQWGHQDWEDVQAVIGFMQNYPGVDSSKLGVIGASFGGYMAQWITAHTQVFKAAVADRAVCNLVSMFGTTDITRQIEVNWQELPCYKPEVLWDQSPLKYVDQVTTPTLILHGEGDLRVGIEQAEQWFAALRLRGIPARFVRYPLAATHDLPRSGPPDLRLHRIEQIVMWFDAHLQADE